MSDQPSNNRGFQKRVDGMNSAIRLTDMSDSAEGKNDKNGKNETVQKEKRRERSGKCASKKTSQITMGLGQFHASTIGKDEQGYSSTWDS